MSSVAKLGRVRNVEVFQVGLRKGKPFTESDLDDAVANFAKFSSGDEKLIDPSLGLGHNEQEIKNNDGLPRYGGFEKVWKEKFTCDSCGGSRVLRGEPCGFCDNLDGKPSGIRTVMKADFADVPSPVGTWIDQKAYTRGSIEFYPEKHPSIANVPTKGIAIRRFVLLGSDLPGVSSLKPLQKAKMEFKDVTWATPMRFSDWEESDGLIMCFSDRKETDRDALGKLGLSQELIAKMSDAEVESLLKIRPQDKVVVFNDMCMADAYQHCRNMGMPVEPSSLHYKDKVHPKETLRAHMSMSDVHRTLTRNGYEHHGGGKFIHKSTKHEMHVDHDGENPHIVKYSDKPESDMNAKEVADLVTASLAGQVKDMVESQVKTAIDGAIKTFSDQLKPIQQDVRDFQSSTHRDAIQKFCDDELANGRLFAFEFDRGPDGRLPNIVDRLCKLDAAPVYKFSDGGREVMLSELDVAKRDIQQRPQRLGEKSKQGADGRGTSDSNGDDKARFDKFSDEFGDELVATGWDRDGTWKVLEAMPPADRRKELELLEKAGRDSRAA